MLVGISRYQSTLILNKWFSFFLQWLVQLPNMGEITHDYHSFLSWKTGSFLHDHDSAIISCLGIFTDSAHLTLSFLDVSAVYFCVKIVKNLILLWLRNFPPKFHSANCAGENIILNNFHKYIFHPKGAFKLKEWK